MLYKSPIPLLRHAGFDKEDLDPVALLKIQKRLLVELDHAGSGHLQVDDQTFTKDDILLLTNELKDSKVVHLHNLIFANPQLLLLLEKGTVSKEPGTRLFNNDLRWSPRFEELRQFVSPYLVQPVAKGISQSLQKFDFGRAWTYLRAKDLITDADFDQTFGKVRHALVGIIQEIRRMEKKEVPFRAAYFRFVPNYFVDFMNDLPDALSNIREAMATGLVNLTVTYQKSNRYFCGELYLYLGLLDCSENLKKLIKNNAAAIRPAAEAAHREPASGRSAAGIVISIIAFMLGIVRVCSHTTHSTTSTSPIVLSDQTRSFEAVISHQFLRQKLISITSGQLRPQGPDSLKKIMSELPETAADAWPYPDSYFDVEKYLPPGESPVKIMNNSVYDAVVFVTTGNQRYSGFLSRNDSLTIFMANRDVLSFYVGTHWSNKINFYSQGFGSGQHLSGIFTNVDSTTIQYLKRDYKLNCSEPLNTGNCGRILIELRSDGEDGLSFKADKPNLFAE